MPSRWFWPAVLATALLVSVGARAAEEAGGAEGGAAPRAREGDRGADRERFREIFRKMRAGEQLTAEEKALAERLRPDRRAPGAEGAAGPAGARPERPRGAELPGMEGLELVNAVDAVKIALAAVHLSKNQADEAVKALEPLLAEDGDETARGFARLLLARALRQKGEADKAEAELKKVTGPAAVQALLELLGRNEPTAERLEELLKGAQDPLVRAVLVRRLTGLYARAGDVAKLADLAARAAALLRREQALAAVELEALLRAGRGGREGGMPEWAQPGGMDRMFRQQREQQEARIKALEAEGKKEEAAQLREQLERMDRVGEWFRRGGGPGRRDAAAADVERLEKQIKELDDAGMKKEADAKRKELEELKARPERRPRQAEPVPPDVGEQF